jgi:hypothetical protein
MTGAQIAFFSTLALGLIIFALVFIIQDRKK